MKNQRFTVSTKIGITTVSWAPNQHIRMISEGCDTEDWSNGCWTFRFAITGINYILKLENNYLKLQYLKNKLKFLLYFWSNKCSLVELMTFFSLFKKNRTDPKLLNGSVNEF